MSKEFKPTLQHVIMACGIAVGLSFGIKKSEEDAAALRNDVLKFGELAVEKGSLDVKESFVAYMRKNYQDRPTREEDISRAYSHITELFAVADAVLVANF